MIESMRALWWILGSRLKSCERLEAENLALRHQVAVLRRPAPHRLRFRGSDRFLFVWLYRLWPSVLSAIIIVQPETVVRLHRGGFKAILRDRHPIELTAKRLANRTRLPIAWDEQRALLGTG